MKKKENRMSMFTAVMIILSLVVMLVVLKFYVFDNYLKNDTNSESAIQSTVAVDEVKDITGEDHVKVEDGVKVNTSQNLENEKVLGVFVFNNFYAYSVDGLTRIEFDVTNVSENYETLEDFKLNVYTDKEKAGRFSCEGDEFAANETKRLSVTVDADLSNMYDIELEKVYNQKI